VSSMSRGLSKDGLLELSRAVEAIEASGMRNGSSNSAGAGKPVVDSSNITFSYMQPQEAYSPTHIPAYVNFVEATTT
jgi:hypothetical protein